MGGLQDHDGTGPSFSAAVRRRRLLMCSGTALPPPSVSRPMEGTEESL